MAGLMYCSGFCCSRAPSFIARTHFPSSPQELFMTDILRPSRELIKRSAKATTPPQTPPATPLPSHKNRLRKNGDGMKNGKSGHDEMVGVAPLPGIPLARVAASGELLDRRELLAALTALKKGDFTVRLPMGMDGLDGKLADAFNEVIELNHRMAQELERLSRVVGKEGRISERASIGHVQGAWAAEISAVNAPCT